MRVGLHRASDHCLVPLQPLAEALVAFLETWNLRHPQIAGQWGLDPDAPIPLRGTEWLTVETGLDEDLIRTVKRRKIRVVELVVFDLLTTAMDCPELIHDPRVQVLANPRVAHAAGCCGGSTAVVA
jgi:hypothetical protein